MTILINIPFGAGSGTTNDATVTQRAGVLCDVGGPYDIFVVTGTVRVLALWAYVDLVIGAAATSVGLFVDPTVGPDTPFTTNSSIENSVVGTMIGVVADPTFVSPPQLLPAFAGVALSGGVGFIFAPGEIKLAVDAGGTTGSMTWNILWQPMTTGATITAAP
jgi:hypothetical protein